MNRSFETSSRAGSWPTLGGVALALLLAGPVLASACSDDEGDGDGSAGAGGGTANAGSGGSAGSGTGGSGMAGNAGSGMVGSAGAGGSSAAGGPTGSIEVLSADTAQLLGPTTAALRGQNVWVANGQLSNLFSQTPMTQLPFSAVSIPLAGGDVAATEIELEGDDFYPEGIAAAEDGTLYIGSIGQSTIVRVPVNSTEAEEFLADGVVQTAVIGLKVDDERELLWFCDSDPTDMPRTGAVVGVSLDDGEEVVRHELAATGQDSLFCNDLIVDPDGNLWVTESIAGLIYKIDADDVMDADSAEIWMNGGLAGPAMAGAFAANGLVLAGDTLIVANVGAGTLFAVDPTSTNPVADARAIPLFEGNTGNVTLCGPDGLIGVPGSDDEIVVVENGGCTPSAPRVVRITLDLD
jgi:hypothetical protein